MKKYFRDIYMSVWTVLVGMKITFNHIFMPTVTIQYPDVKRKLPERARNRLYVNMDDCIGCFQCDLACPVNCFAIETAKSLPTEDLGMTSTGQKKKMWVTEFTIDIGKCCYCGLCTYPCPTECIKMTDVYEFSEFNRQDLIYNYVTLTDGEIKDIKEKAAQMEKEAAAKKAAAAAAPKPAVPAGTPVAPKPVAAGTPVAPKPAVPAGTAPAPKPVASAPAPKPAVPVVAPVAEAPKQENEKPSETASAPAEVASTQQTGNA